MTETTELKQVGISSPTLRKLFEFIVRVLDNINVKINREACKHRLTASRTLKVIQMVLPPLVPVFMEITQPNEKV